MGHSPSSIVRRPRARRPATMSAFETARRDGDVYRLNGKKRYIVSAGVANRYMVYARTDPDAPPRDGLSCFLVERDDSVEVT